MRIKPRPVSSIAALPLTPAYLFGVAFQETSLKGPFTAIGNISGLTHHQENKLPGDTDKETTGNLKSRVDSYQKPSQKTYLLRTAIFCDCCAIGPKRSSTWLYHACDPFWHSALPSSKQLDLATTLFLRWLLNA